MTLLSMDEAKFPVAKLKKSTIEKILRTQSRAEIVYNAHIGRMLLIAEREKVRLPGYWWCLDTFRLTKLSPKKMEAARRKPDDVDDSRPYKSKKHVICEIQMIDGRSKNHVDEKVWARLRKL